MNTDNGLKQKSNLKNVGIVVVLVALFGLFGASKHYGWFVPNTENGAMAAQSPASNGADVVDRAKSALGIGQTAPNVNIELPPQPVNGTPKGVIVLGASGFDSFVVNMDSQKRYTVTSKKFGDSLAYEGLTNTDEVKTTLKKYLAQMLNKGVSGNNLHFVISSGALKEEKTKVIAENIRKAGYVVNEVTPEQEGKYAFRAAMNPAYINRAFVVDIGSGNTKISWFEGSTVRTIEASGSKYFQSGITDADVVAELANKTNQIPTKNRQFCFLIGGVPNDLAKIHGSNDSYYIPLNSLNSYSAGDNKKVASGLNILKGIQQTTNTTFVFDNMANFTIGFLMSIR
jgi:hypothetical protein